MTYFDAAVEVLRRHGRPMTDREITDLAIGSGLIVPAGKTPRQTMSATLYMRSLDPASPIQRVAEPGRIRARRGSVRWALR